MLIISANNQICAQMWPVIMAEVSKSNNRHDDLIFHAQALPVIAHCCY